MSRLDEIRARVEAVNELSPDDPGFNDVSLERSVQWLFDWETLQRHSPQDILYLLTLVDEAREIFHIAYGEEAWQSWFDRYEAWLAKVDGEGR